MSGGAEACRVCLTAWRCDVDMSRVDVQLLRDQRWYLLVYPWADGAMSEEIEGLVNLLDYLIDELDDAR